MTGFTAVVSGETAITTGGMLRAAAERVLGRRGIDQVPVRLASEEATALLASRCARPVIVSWGRRYPAFGNDLRDARAARADGRPVVRLHLQDRWAGLARLLDSARGGA